MIKFIKIFSLTFNILKNKLIISNGKGTIIKIKFLMRREMKINLFC